MNAYSAQPLYETTYDPKGCGLGIVHLGFGAFHRAHQAQYIDDYMQATEDLRWGIAAVNIRTEDSTEFAKHSLDGSGYILKSMAPSGGTHFRRIRPHIQFCDWAQTPDMAQELLAQPSVKMVTITVTESGYYLDDTKHLNTQDPIIAAEIAGQSNRSVYNYLMHALDRRYAADAGGLTILCCDNIRQNGKMLQRNFASYLNVMKRRDLAQWVDENVTFPCSMVDRITPRSTDTLLTETTTLFGPQTSPPVMAEEFIQWAVEDHFAAAIPDLAQVGVTIAPNVDHFEETKIRILNGGHTCLAYMAALKGIETFDQAINDPELFSHFEQYQRTEVLPALTIDTPFDKVDYLQAIIARFKNVSIGDTVERICADGFLKFPIFVAPTLRGSLAQGHMPHYALKSIASWYIFCRLHADGKLHIQYDEPNWDKLAPLIAKGALDAFTGSDLLWGDIPEIYPEFANDLKNTIHEMEQIWLV